MRREVGKKKINTRYIKKKNIEKKGKRREEREAAGLLKDAKERPTTQGRRKMTQEESG